MRNAVHTPQVNPAQNPRLVPQQSTQIRLKVKIMNRLSQIKDMWCPFLAHGTSFAWRDVARCGAIGIYIRNQIGYIVVKSDNIKFWSNHGSFEFSLLRVVCEINGQSHTVVRLSTK